MPNPTKTDEIITQMTEDDDLRFTLAANVAAKDVATCPESHRIKRVAEWAAVFTYYVQDRIEDYVDDEEEEEEWVPDLVIGTPEGQPIVSSRHVNAGEYLGADHE